MAMLDLLVPPRCLACARTGTEPLCGACAALLEPDGEGYELAPGVVAVAAFTYADPIARAIKRVKTDALRAGARSLAGLLDLPTGAPRTWVPAPLARRRRRGLDLPEVLAGPDAVRLLRATRSRADQPGLDAAGRRRSAIGAYIATGPSPTAVVLVDDVRATGATLLAAATALQAAGTRRVLCLTLAASPGPPSAASPGPPSAASSGPPSVAAARTADPRRRSMP